MRLIYVDELKIIVLLDKKYLDIDSFNNLEILEKNLRLIFSDLKKIYDLNITGEYFLEIFVDNQKIIVELNKEEDSLFEYYDNEVDMRINVHKDIVFLYEIEDIFSVKKDIVDRCVVYYFNEKFFLSTCELNDLDYSNLLEQTVKIHYKNIDKIIKDRNKVIV